MSAALRLVGAIAHWHMMTTRGFEADDLERLERARHWTDLKEHERDEIRAQFAHLAWSDAEERIVSDPDVNVFWVRYWRRTGA